MSLEWRKMLIEFIELGQIPVIIIPECYSISGVWILIWEIAEIEIFEILPNVHIPYSVARS